ncbi:MAG: hypothetical protein DMF60_04360, partial [Acidobacteria bacterium]
MSLDLGSAIADSITTRGLPTLTTTDVSPNATFGSTSTGESNNSILYAASQMAGVWKSVDGGRNWKQAGAGLRAGNTQNNYSLAVDFVNPQHLLYAAMDDDGRNAISCPENVVEVECNYGGLWVSDTGAASWVHVDLPGCHHPSISSVVFAGGRPFVATGCGIATASGSSLASATWLLLPNTPFGTGAILASSNSPSQTLFACQGQGVYRSESLGSADSWTVGPNPGGPCLGVAWAPLDELQPSSIVVMHDV